MSTRGILGFHIGGEGKIAYNETNSVPAALGKNVICALHNILYNRATLEHRAAQLEAVPFEKMPMLDQLQKVKAFHPNGTGTADEEWSRMVSETQGDLKAMMRAGLYEDEKHFVRDSRICEWGYVANLDKSVLEVYRGGQKQSHGKGRFAEMGRSDRRNYPVASVGKIPFETI